MNTFEASNGVKVYRTPAGNLTTSNWSAFDSIDDFDASALREFFQHERDEELGRWRWPENPEYVVYPHEDGGGRVWNERSCEGGYRNGLYAHDPEGQAVKAYRESQPAKPWHQAIPGQAWVVDWNTGDEAFSQALLVADFSAEGRVFADAEEKVTLPIISPMITDARRIYPVEVSS